MLLTSNGPPSFARRAHVGQAVHFPGLASGSPAASVVGDGEAQVTGLDLEAEAVLGCAGMAADVGPVPWRAVGGCSDVCGCGLPIPRRAFRRRVEAV
jgi:hypothetical protein